MGRVTFEPGRYIGKLTKQQFGQTSTGKPQIVLSFNILGRVNMADPDGALLPCPQYERSVFRTITPKTIDWVVKDLDTLGFNGSTFAEFDPNTAGFQNLTGTECTLFCDHETYEGEEKERWGIFNGEGFTAKPLEQKEVRQLDAMFGKALKGRKPAVAQTPRATVPITEAAATHEVDPKDLPF